MVLFLGSMWYIREAYRLFSPNQVCTYSSLKLSDVVLYLSIEAIPLTLVLGYNLGFIFLASMIAPISFCGFSLLKIFYELGFRYTVGGSVIKSFSSVSLLSRYYLR